MTPDELSVVRPRLEAFAADVFTPLVRSDQRAKGETYLRGLLLNWRRKSMQPMAQRLGVDHHGLQQFVSTSTWDTTAVRMRLARWALEVVEPVAWVVDDTGFPKDGKGSPGVARQYSGTYAPTGAMIAAPTAALPEEIGGSRNWDYRYTWVRDTSFSVNALLGLGFTEEARRYMDWLDERIREAGDNVIPPESHVPGRRLVGPP